MTMTSVYAPITKTVEQDDGSVLVYGKATDGGLDGDLQRCSPTWLATAMPDWYRSGANVREQHDSKRAIGRAIEHEVDGDAHYLTARIVDPVAVLKTKAGVFNGFSIGISHPKISKSVEAPNGVIDGGQVVEVSLVDRPSNASCLITLVKSATPGMEVSAADFDEERGLVRCEELVEKTVDAKESQVPTLAETLAPEALERLAAAVEPTELPEPAAVGSGVPMVVVSSRSVSTSDEPSAVKAADFETPAETGGDGGDSGDTAPAFDKAAAVELVDSMLAKAEGDDTVMELAPVEAPSDEVVASVAISLIAGLIQSEAAGMVDNPDEDADIKCLLNAVAALRWFIRRERSEGGTGGASDAAPYEYMAAAPDAEKAIVVKGQEFSPDLVAEVDKATKKAAERNELGDLAPADAVTRIKSVSTDQVESIAKAAVDTAFSDLADSVAAQRGDDPAPAAKTATPETTKAETVETDGDALVKALSAALEKSDSPLRNAFDTMITKATETTAQAVTELTARLVKVESMAVPGGPALRRTETERTSARVNDLAGQVRHYKSLEAATHDQTLRKGYAATAAQLETELKALSV